MLTFPVKPELWKTSNMTKIKVTKQEEKKIPDEGKEINEQQRLYLVHRNSQNFELDLQSLSAF